MIGIHISKYQRYEDHHENFSTKIEGMWCTVSYHKGTGKQAFYENENLLVLIDGWVFNSESYVGQAEFVADIYDNKGTDVPLYLNGQFNILIHDKTKNLSLLFNDIFGFRKLFINKDNEISSDLSFLRRNGSSLNIEHIRKNLNYPRFLSSDETFYNEIYPLEPSSILNLDSGEVKRYKINSFYKDSPEVSDWSIEQINSKITQNISETHKSSIVVIGLSGGMDSRFLLEHLLKTSSNVESLTYGIEYSDEVNIAREVAEKCGIKQNNLFLNSSDFTRYATRYVDQIGGLDIFPQSFIYLLENKKFTGKVLDTGFALDVYLGGTQVDRIDGGKATGLTNDHFDFSLNNIYAEPFRVFTSLMYRQVMLREYIDDRYSLFHYDNYFLIKALKDRLIQGGAFYYDLARNVIQKSYTTPLQSTMFDLSLEFEDHKEAERIQILKEQFVQRKVTEGKTLYHRRYYSDFGMWLINSDSWKGLLNDLLFSSELNGMVEIEKIQKLVTEHKHGQSSHIRDLIRLITTNLFIKSHKKE